MKKVKRIIGFTLIASPYVAGFLICGFTASWVMASVIFGGGLLVVGLVFLGAKLIED